MSRIRVALDVTSLVGAPTGIHQATRGLLDALRARDDVDLRGWLLSARGRRPEVGVPVRRTRIPAAMAIRGWAHADFPPGRLVAGRADVVHGTNFLAPPNERSVITVQDLTPVIHPSWCVPEVAAMAAPMANAIARGATVHVSSALVGAEVVEALRVEPARVRVVHHGIRPIGAGDAALATSLAGADRYVLVLGTVEHRKNVPGAIAAMAELPDDVRLVVAGPVGNAEEDVQAAIAALDPTRVVRLTSVDRHARDALIRGAAVLAWPSLYEGFAMPPLEALSVGTPVVATAVGALPELVGDAIPLVAAGDDAAFIDALAAAVASRPAVPAAVVERIEALTWDRAAAEMMTVYRDVAGR